jgi:hypothetical protein
LEHPTHKTDERETQNAKRKVPNSASSFPSWYV